MMEPATLSAASQTGGSGTGWLVSLAAHAALIAGGAWLFGTEAPPAAPTIAVEIVVADDPGGAAVEERRRTPPPDPAPVPEEPTIAAAAVETHDPAVAAAPRPTPRPNRFAVQAPPPRAKPKVLEIAVATTSEADHGSDGETEQTSTLAQSYQRPSISTGPAAPPSLALPLEGEGNYCEGAATAFPPPLRGRDRVGGPLCNETDRRQSPHQSSPPGAPGAENPSPRYPFIAREKGWEGRVVLVVTVDIEGSAQDVRVKRSSDYAVLDRAALEAVRRWRFQPAIRSGHPVSGTIDVPITFRLKDQR